MHDETVDGAESVTGRIEHVQIGGILGVEAVQCRGGAEADCDDGSRRQVQAAKPQLVVGFAATVDALPQTL